MHRNALIGIIVKLLLGSFNYFAARAMNLTCDYPIVGVSKGDPKCPEFQTPFKKAFFLVFCTFFSLSICMIIFVGFRKKKADPEPYKTKRNYILMMIPATAEAVAFCMSISAQAIMALSLAMIMKGGKVIFSALFTVILFRKPLPWFKWFGVFACIAGLAVAGSSEYMKVAETGDSAVMILIGLSLSVASEALFAFQVIFDEKMMKVKKCDQTFCIGMEGIYGMIIVLPVVLIAWLAIPGNQNGAYEDLADTFYRIGRSPIIIGLLSYYLVGVFIHAIADSTITKYLSGVHSSLVSVGRTVVVWILEIVFFYSLPGPYNKQYGQEWSSPWSYVKIVGFAIVVASIFIYDGSLRVPGFNYSSVDKKNVEVKTTTSETVLATEETNKTAPETPLTNSG